MIPNGLIEPNKIYIIGDRQVGKTNLVNRLTNKEFEVHTIISIRNREQCSCFSLSL